jgi:HNH endonuclease
MRCLFCAEDSSGSKSVEHVIPESLWNTTHVLPRGVVCDSCNNYFAREIEKPFLEAPAVARLRFVQAIPNKRGRIPPSEGVLLPGFPALLHRDASRPGSLSLDLPDEAIRHLLARKTAKVVIPATSEGPSDRVVSRFLAKVALEAMALRLVDYPDGLEYLVDEPQLHPIRRFVRRGQPESWPHHARRIYALERVLVEQDGLSYQTVHEFDFVVTASQEWFFVLSLFGLELTINLGGPDIDGYVSWLSEHDGQSPLYSGKNVT